MMNRDDPDDASGGDAEGPSPERPRTTNLAAVAAAVILIGLVAFALYRRAHPPAPPGEVSGEPASSPTPGTTITAVVPYHLTPEASILAERYRCVCGCDDLLNVCTCNKTPGSNDMKRVLQDLVSRKLTPALIDQEMSGRFGPTALLASNPPVAKPTATPRPSAPRKSAAPRRKP